MNSSGSVTSWFFNVLAGDKVVGRQPSIGNRRYYHTDLLGSTRSVVEGASVVESYDFEPWGVLMPGRTLAGPTKEGFTGKEQDAETGLDYFGARYYMPALGRWTSVDPMADGSPEWNPYHYTRNNPVAWTDPLGLCEPWPECVWIGFLALLRGDSRGSEAQESVDEQDAAGTKAAQQTAQGQQEQAPITCSWITLSGCKQGDRKLNPLEDLLCLATMCDATEEERIEAAKLDLMFMGTPIGGVAGRVTSRIARHPALVREASTLSGSLQRSIDHLTAQLARGNLNPGIGTKHLFGDIFYARSRDGARVFFRRSGDGIEILAKATKANESKVIALLESIYR